MCSVGSGAKIGIGTFQVCTHQNVESLNEYELVRKYRCSACSEIMMCECDRARGTKFLSHQLEYGVELNSQQRVRVTLGFQLGICRECRGLSPTASPTASTPGRTSKVKRYYWRELHFREFEILSSMGMGLVDIYSPEASELRKKAASQALEDIKRIHEQSPKYHFDAESEVEFLKRVPVDKFELKAAVIEGGLIKRADGVTHSSEEFVIDHLKCQGFSIDSMRKHSDSCALRGFTGATNS